MTPATPLFADLDVWASHVAGFADFPDERLNTRFAQTLATLAAKPLDSFPQACESAGQAKATYRFFSNKRLTSADFLQPLADATADGCRGQSVVLSVQDSTSLNYTTLKTTKGLGLLNDSPRARGLHLHSTMALRVDGVPIGLFGQHYWNRPVEQAAVPPDPKRPIEEKESYKWLRGIEAAEAAVLSLLESERPRLIHVMDREGDIHEVLQRITDSPHGAVIRSVQNRSVDGPINKSIQAVRAAPLLGIHCIDVPANHGQPRRKARCELRSVTLILTPDARKHPHRKQVTWTLVEAREVDAPAGVAEPLCWLLWTTEPASTRAQIIGVLNIYKLRWRIEDFHLTLKSGCRAEALELETAERLTKAVMLYSMIAVRIVALRDLARQEPDAPCTTILSDDAWRALYAKFEKKAFGSDTPVPTVRQAILWIGRLGGHLNRKRDGMPGVRTLWRGWRDLTILVAGYRLGRKLL
jgi:Transposase DNA-binding/Transposase Tn5 dimerisation domain